VRGSSTWWYVFAISFVVVALAESFLPQRSLASSTPRRWTNNSILLAISSGLALCIYQLTGVALACSMAANSRGALNHVGLPNWVRFVVAFAILDLTAYASHRMFHAVDPMWRVHSVHHSETDLDLTTGFRFHPVEAVFVQGLFLIVIAVLGLPPGAVALVTLAVVVQDFFTHANLRFSEPADRWLRILIVTPGMHRVHHSENISQQNSNFGTIFSAWDRLFGTYSQGLAPDASARCGLTEIQNGSDLNAAGLLWLPFRRRPTNNPEP
jgi:sterol desaturase/sphingolipid hydroxylase (fatty acid hydroxylase superfamily)